MTINYKSLSGSTYMYTYNIFANFKIFNFSRIEDPSFGCGTTKLAALWKVVLTHYVVGWVPL